MPHCHQSSSKKSVSSRFAFDVERTNKVSHRCFAYRDFIALGLKVDGVQAKKVVIDDAVDTVVCASLSNLTGLNCPWGDAANAVSAAYCMATIRVPERKACFFMIGFSVIYLPTEILSLGGFARGGLAGFISFFTPTARLLRKGCERSKCPTG